MQPEAFTLVQPTAPAARHVLSRFVAEVLHLLPHGFTVEQALETAAVSFAEPRGLFLAYGESDTPLAGGGLSFLDEERAEIKRLWVDPAARGQGLGVRLLAELEARALAHGRHTVVLDTNDALPVVAALYDNHGYTRVPAYNDNRDANLWFEKRLA